MGRQVASASDPPIFSEHLKSLLDRDDMAWFRTVGLPRVMRCWLSGSRWKYSIWNIPSLKLTASLHLKLTPWKRRFLLENIIFRCYLYVSFRECSWFISTHRNCVPNLLSTVKGGFTIVLLWLWCTTCIYIYIYSALLRFLLDDHLSSQRRSSWPNRRPKNTVVYLARILRINDTFNASRNKFKKSTARWCCW